MNRADYTLLGIAIFASLLVLVPLIASAEAQVVQNATIPITYNNGTTFNQPAFINATGTWLISDYMENEWRPAPYVAPPPQQPSQPSQPSQPTYTPTYTPPVPVPYNIAYPDGADEYYLHDGFIKQIAERTTVGSNFILVENFETGKATWTATSEKIEDGFTVREDGTGVPIWKNYDLTTNSNQVIFKSNSIGGLIYDIPTCSYSIYENGYNGAQTIPSISWLARVAVDGTDNWSSLTELNNQQCDVTVETTNETVKIISTKTISQQNEITYNKMIEVGETNNNVITLENGISYNLVDYVSDNMYVDPSIIMSNHTKGYEISVTENINTDTQIIKQILELDIKKGLKETINIVNNDNLLNNHKFGAIQTLHTSDILTIGDQVFDIAQASGTVLTREWIMENEVDVLGLAQNINYSIDQGIYMISSVSVLYDELLQTGKISIDYSNAPNITPIGGTMVIDPNITVSGVDSSGTITFDLSSLPVNTLISQAEYPSGTVLSSSDLSAIQSSIGSTWSTSTVSVIEEAPTTFTTPGTTTFTVPTGTTSITAKVWGAGGGGEPGNSQRHGGGGGGYSGVFDGSVSHGNSIIVAGAGAGGPHGGSGGGTTGGHGYDFTWYGGSGGTQTSGGGVHGYSGTGQPGSALNGGDGQNVCAPCTGGTGTGTGGGGGFVQGTISVSSGDSLVIAVGGGGAPTKYTNAIGGGGAAQAGGGGGGSGYYGGGAGSSACCGGYGSGGGGSSYAISSATNVINIGAGIGPQSTNSEVNQGQTQPVANSVDEHYPPDTGNGGDFQASGERGAVVLVYMQNNVQTDLVLTYDLTSFAADPPTNLVASDGLPIGLSWNAPTYFGADKDNNPFTSVNYGVARTTSANSMLELPDNSGTNAGLDFSDNEFLLHGLETTTTRVSSLDGTNNGATTGVTGKIGNAWQFDGSNDDATAGVPSDWKFLNDGSTSWTITSYLKDADVGSDKHYFGTSEDTSSGHGIRVGTNSNGMRIYTLNSNADIAGISYTSSTNFHINESTWRHYAMVFDSTAGTFKVYKDGVADTNVGTMTAFVDGTSNDPLTFGRNPSAQNYFTGMTIDEVGFFKGVLTSSEITSLANGNSVSSISRSDLYAYYDFEQTGTTLENQVFNSVTSLEDKSTNSVTVEAGESLGSAIQKQRDSYTWLSLGFKLADETLHASNMRFLDVSPYVENGSTPALTIVADGTTYTLPATSERHISGSQNQGCSNPSSGTIGDASNEWFIASAYSSNPTYNKCHRAHADFDISSIPVGATITEATLEIKLDGNTMFTTDFVDVYLMSFEASASSSFSDLYFGVPAGIQIASDSVYFSGTGSKTFSVMNSDSAVAGTLPTSTTGTIGTALQDPDLVYTDSNLPDNTDTLSVGGFVKLDIIPATTPTSQDDFTNGQGDWEVSGSGGTLTFTNEINQASSGSSDMKIPYVDLQNSSYLGSGNYASETEWVLRWQQTWSDAPDNYGTPFMLLSSTTGVQSASQNYIGIRFDGSSITGGGETSSSVDGASSSTGISTSYTSTTYYMEMVRDGSNMYVRNYVDSAYDTIAQESSAISIGSGTYDLRYIKMIPRWDTGSGSFDTILDNIKFYNDMTTVSGITPPTNTKLLGLNDIVFNVGTTTASISEFTPVPPTTEDFTSCTNDTCGGKWTDNAGGNAYVSTGSDYVYFRNDSTNKGISGDLEDYLGAGARFGIDSNGNPTSFVIRWNEQVNFYSSSPKQSDSHMMMLSEKDHTSVNNSNQQTMGTWVQNYRHSTMTLNQQLTDSSGTSPATDADSSGADIIVENDFGLSGANVYYEMIMHYRAGGASFVTLAMFSDSGYSTPTTYSMNSNYQSTPNNTGQLSNIPDSAWDDLRYIVIGDDYQSTNPAGYDIIYLKELIYYPATEVAGAGGAYVSFVSATGLTDNSSTPQHYAVTRDASNLWTIYQNGVSKATATDSTSLGSNSVRDSSLDGTNNGATTGATGKLGNAWSFDGSNDYVEIGTSPMGSVSGDFGISFWIKSSDFGSGGYGAPAIMGSYDSGSSGGNHWQIYENGGAIKLSDGSTTITTSITGIEDGAWHHVLLTRSGSTVTAYKDGSSASTHSYTPDFPSPSSYLKLGQRGDGNQYTTMNLDQVTFYDKALTSTEVQTLYNSGSGDSTPDTNGMIAHYDFEQTGSTLENQGTSPADYTTNLSGTLDEFFVNSDVLTSTELAAISARGIDSWVVLANPDNYPLSQTELPNNSIVEGISTVTSYDINNADTQQETRSGSTTSNGVQILSGNSAIGHSLSEIMFPLKKSGSPPDTFRYEVYNNAGTLQAQTPTSSANSLTTSFVDTTLTLTTPHTIAAGDRIVVTYSSGDISNKILVSEDNSVGSIPSTTTHTAYNSGWSESTAQWSNAKFVSSIVTSSTGEEIDFTDNEFLLHEIVITEKGYEIENSVASNTFTLGVASNTGGTVSLDGTKFWTTGNYDLVYETTCSTAFDISTCSGNTNVLSMVAQDTSTGDIFWNNQHTKFYQVGNSNDKVYEYTCTSVDDPSSCTYSTSLSVITDPEDAEWSLDETKLFVLMSNYGTAGNVIKEYSCSVAGQVDTCTDNSSNLDLASLSDAIQGMAWNDDHTEITFTGSLGDGFETYTGCTVDDISTCTADSTKTFSVSSQDGYPTELFFNNDGSKVYMVGQIGTTIDEYTIPIATVSTVTDKSTNSVPVTYGLVPIDFEKTSISSTHSSSGGQTLWDLATTSDWNTDSGVYDAISSSADFVLNIDWEKNGDDNPYFTLQSDTSYAGVSPPTGEKQFKFSYANNDQDIRYSLRYNNNIQQNDVNSSGTNFGNNVIGYFQIIKSGNTMDYARYGSDADRASQTNALQSTATVTLNSLYTTTNDFKYIGHGYDGSSGTNTLHNVELWIGTDSPSAQLAPTSTTGTIGTALQNPDLIYTDADLPDNTDTLSVGGFVKLDETVIPDVTDDFASDNWVDNDSGNIGVSSGTMNWNAKRDGSNDASVYDLGSAVSDNWTLRFNLDVTSVSSSTQAGNGFFVGLSDSDQTVGQSTTQDFIGVSIYNDNTDTYQTIDADGATIPRMWQGDNSQTTTYSTGSVWYYEIIKTGSSYTVEAFSNSDYSTGSEGKITGSSDASGLQYIKIINEDDNISTSTNPFQGTIDDIVLTQPSIPPANTKLLNLNDVTFNVGTDSASVGKSVTNIQGYDGGDGVSGGAGGGGGAGSASSDKNGGNGRASSITGSSVIYAGGGGAAFDGTNARGIGGTGGGGDGGSNNQASSGGTDGLGGGAGGGGNVQGNDGTGGSGVVILSFTTSGTTYSTTGSPNVDTSTVSGKTILKYLSSGTFVVSGGTPNVEYLVVAGGGGSMENWGHSGGAGGGGMLEGTKSSMPNASYTVTVGSGGANGGGSAMPSQGGNSVFSDITATGGGYGGNWYSGSTNTGGDGGSGGGGQTNYAGGSGLISTASSTIISATGLTDNTSTAQHYAVTRDASNLWTIYQNGVSKATATDSTSLGANSVRDSSKDGTNNGATTGATGKVGDAWDFTTSDSVYVEIPSPSPNTNTATTKWTLNAWVNLQSTSHEGFIGTGTSSSDRIDFRYHQGQDDFGYVEYGDATGSGSYGMGNYDTTATGWYMVTWVRDGLDWTHYINGAVGGTHTASASTLPSDSLADGNWKIGQAVSYTPESWTGEIDEMSFWSEALTSSDVTALYASSSGIAFTDSTFPEKSNIIAHYDFEQTGSTLENQGTSTADYTTKLSGTLDEFFINSDTLSAGEISDINQRGSTDADYTTSSTTFNDSTVIAGNEYYYKVYSVTPGVPGIYSIASNVDSAQTVNTANAPAGVTATNGITQANVSWNASTDLGGGTTLAYKIYKNTNGGAYSLLAQPSGTGTTYTDTAVTLGNTYGYKIVTVNEAGDSPQSNPATTVIGTVPDPPTLTLVTPIVGAQHTIDWTAPSNNGGFAVTGYEIERSTTSGSGFATVGQVGNVLTWTDPTANLVLGDTYYYKVLAINQQGTSTPSNEGSGLTGDKPSAVTNVTADALVNYEINVNWTPANDNFYAITGYEIFASENGATAISVGTTPQAQTQFLHQSLNSGSTYTYAVYATNSLGTSAISNTPSTIAGDIPGVPTGLTVTPVVPSQIDVAWGASSANGYTPTYTVAISTDSGNTWDETTHTGLSVLTLSQTSLVNGQTYQYKVSATNTLGTSAYTAVVSGVAGDVPAVPTGLSVTPISATELTFAWGVPNDNGYSITGYKVERSTDNITFTIIDPNFQSNVYQDTGLTTSTAYYYKVSAINGLGTSAASNSANGQTFGVPNPVSTLALTTISTSQINLTWSQPALNGFTFVDYTIERSFDGVVWQNHATTTNTTYQDTLNTNDNTEYHYRIYTQNSFGTSVAGNAELTYTLPTPPAAVTTTVQSDVQVDLVWNNPTGTAHSGFLIEQSIDSGVTWTTVITTTNQNLSYNTLGLTPLTDYQFRVSTINQAGTSVPSPVATATTFGHPDVPTGLTATALPGSQIQLDWVAPTVVNGSPVTEYKIERSTDGGTTWGPLVANTGNLNITYTDTGLTTTQEYHYRVSAYNIYGVGNPGTESSAIASDVPSQVTGLTATPTINYTIDLSWTTPNGNGYAVSGYTIERNIAGAGWVVLVADTGSTTTTYADINLSAATNYDYRVSAINVVGTGQVSATASSNAGDVPDAPVLTLTALPGSIIQLDWTVPTNNGFAITTYAVEKSTDGTNWSPLTSINANTFQDTGLTNSNTYYYKVTAVNQVGNSVFSSPVSIVAGDAPSQVTGLTATTTSNTSIDLAWTAPNANGYAVSGYMIERSADMGATWSTLVANTQSLSVAYADTGLTTGQFYTYKISAINALGTGQASATAVTHAGDVPNAPVLTLTALPNSIIQLDWPAPTNNGFVITTYQVEKSIDSGNTWTPLTSVNALTTQDTGLTNGNSYQYRVLATNTIGNSPFSGAVAMIAGDVPGALSVLTATTQSDTSISLTWTAPNANGYTITGYQIEQSTDGTTWNTIVTNTQNTAVSYTVTGLTDSTDYYFKVTGINALGIGALGPIATAHTFGAPDPFIPLTFSSTTTSATVNWTQPYDHGSPITSYRVEILNLVNGVGNGQWLTLTTTTPTTLTNTHLNLQTNTEYSYRIVATNPYGSVTSSIQPITTLATPPTLTATASSGTTIDLNWSTVSGSTTYSVYSSANDVTFTLLQSGISATTYQATGLSLGQTVYYKVTVTNAAGESAQSTSATATTWSLPGTPTGLTITNPTPTTARFTWTTPTDFGGAPSVTYTLQRSEDNSNWTSHLPSTTTTVDDNSLTLGQQYYWRVNSVTAAGVSGNSNTVSYLTPTLPTAPGSLTAALTGANNNAAVLNWVAPSSTSGYTVIGYHIETNIDGNGWTDLVVDTGNSGLVYTNTGLSAGSSYVYRVSAITAVGEGVPSNTATVNPILVTLTITGTATGGNSVSVSPTVVTSGASSATIVQQALYRDNVRVDLVSLNIPLTSGASIPSMIDYPTQASSFVMTLVLDTGYVIQSNSITLTPSAPFTGEISFNEDRTVYDNSADCLASDPNATWAAPTNPLSNAAFVCSTSYSESVLEFTVQPVGADVIISYQPQNLNEPAIVKAFTATSSAITETMDVDPETDYYGSIIVNPQFEYTINADQTITVVCDPNDIMCDNEDTDPNTAGVQNDVPKGVPSEKTFKSFKSPESTRQLGIEPMGNLFGVNMVFIFVIALAGIFTGRSAPMGVIFIIVTLGIMAFLGYLDFGSDMMNATTWSLLIIAAILGIFLGKRWS